MAKTKRKPTPITIYGLKKSKGNAFRNAKEFAHYVNSRPSRPMNLTYGTVYGTVRFQGIFPQDVAVNQTLIVQVLQSPWIVTILGSPAITPTASGFHYIANNLPIIDNMQVVIQFYLFRKSDPDQRIMQWNIYADDLTSDDNVKEHNLVINWAEVPN